ARPFPPLTLPHCCLPTSSPADRNARPNALPPDRRTATGITRVRLHACFIDFEVIMAFPIRPAAATAAIAACSKNKRWLRPIGIALAGLALSGCVTLSKDGG